MEISTFAHTQNDDRTPSWICDIADPVDSTRKNCVSDDSRVAGKTCTEDFEHVGCMQSSRSPLKVVMAAVEFKPATLMGMLVLEAGQKLLDPTPVTGAMTETPVV